MKRVTLHPRAIADIDRIVAKIHRDVGDPTGKVNLTAVRHVLKLDLNYYRSSDTGLLQEIMHKLQIGAKQVIQRPMLLLDAVKQFDLRALILPDKKKIFIDQDQPALKLRWYEAHEIGHGVIPWHVAYALGDDRRTLSPQCQETIEAEANWGAGRLLFPRATFSEMARDTQASFKHVQALADHFGNTLTTTLWRLVEQSDQPMFGVVGAHPHHANAGDQVIEYFIQSELFAVQFPELTEAEVIAALRSYCRYTKRGPLGTGTVQLLDSNMATRSFTMESFGNTHQCLSLGFV